MLMWFLIFQPLPICYVRVCVVVVWISCMLIFTVPK
jgi:hypothetical protein